MHAVLPVTRETRKENKPVIQHPKNGPLMTEVFDRASLPSARGQLRALYDEMCARGLRAGGKKKKPGQPGISYAHFRNLLKHELMHGNSIVNWRGNRVEVRLNCEPITTKEKYDAVQRIHFGKGGDMHVKRPYLVEHPGVSVKRNVQVCRLRKLVDGIRAEG